jgi:uncharacterized RDD family membrane protein YckC
MSHPTPIGGQQYAGQRLGLPETGPGSAAGWGRRIAALFLDWIASTGAAVLFGYDPFATTREQGWLGSAPLLVFLVEASVLTGLAGGSFGQQALRMAVVRLDGRRVTLLQALVRTLLICLVIPPVVFNRDGRGLHDLAVGTVTVRR